VTDSVLRCSEQIPSIEAFVFPWKDFHVELDPETTAFGPLNAKRASRKRMQIESMLAWIDMLLPFGGELVDFCAGGGHLGLVIAAARPDSRVYLVEKKKQHVEIARRRIEIIGLVRLFTDDGQI
jgi:hypothetical protein